MEGFKEAETNGKITPVVGGKVLVVDIELSEDHSDEAHPKLSVIALKTSYASPVSDSPFHLGFQISIYGIGHRLHAEAQ